MEMAGYFGGALNRVDVEADGHPGALCRCGWTCSTIAEFNSRIADHETRSICSYRQSAKRRDTFDDRNDDLQVGFEALEPCPKKTVRPCCDSHSMNTMSA